MFFINRALKRNTKTKFVLATVASLTALAAFGFAGAAEAVVYNAAVDFSLTNGNPNGVWTYGYETTPGSTLNLFNTTSTQNIGNSTIQFWQSTVVQQSLVPAVMKKTAGANAALGLPVGSIALHGGAGGQYAVLRFTAPTTAVYTVNAQFLSGDSGDTNALILLNNLAGVPLFSAVTTNTNPAYANALALTGGQTLEFLVGTKGNFFSDTTPLNLTISAPDSVTVPEAGTFALVLPALGMIGAVVAQRRKK